MEDACELFPFRLVHFFLSDRRQRIQNSPLTNLLGDRFIQMAPLQATPPSSHQASLATILLSTLGDSLTLPVLRML